MRRVLAPALVALGVVAIVGGVAIAHEERYETKRVKIRFQAPSTFTGKVRARGGCNADRVVKVKPVEEYGGNRRPLGTARTDQNGEWTLALNETVRPGSYKAVTNRTSVEHGDDLHSCKKGVSRPVQVG